MQLKIDIRVGVIATILTTVFVVLKLTHVISWSWVVCFLPLIISAVLAVIILITMLIVMRFVGG